MSTIKGRVLWYDYRDGYGVLEDDQGNEYYFDKSVWKCKASNPGSGRCVKFEINLNIKDTRCAMNVRDVLAEDTA